MTGDLAPIGAKLARLIPMLGSPHDGEAVGAARAIERVLIANGCTWHDLAKVVAGGAPAKPAPAQRQQQHAHERRDGNGYWSTASYAKHSADQGAMIRYCQRWGVAQEDAAEFTRVAQAFQEYAIVSADMEGILVRIHTRAVLRQHASKYEPAYDNAREQPQTFNVDEVRRDHMRMIDGLLGTPSVTEPHKIMVFRMRAELLGNGTLGINSVVKLWSIWHAYNPVGSA